MKKIIALVLTLGFVFGVGATVEDTVSKVVDPSTTVHDEASDFTTYGEPPIGI